MCVCARAHACSRAICLIKYCLNRLTKRSGGLGKGEGKWNLRYTTIEGVSQFTFNGSVPFVCLLPSARAVKSSVLLVLSQVGHPVHFLLMP